MRNLKTHKSILVLLAVLLFSISAPLLTTCLAVEKTPFEKEWALEKTEAKSTFSPALLEVIQDRQVILVSGFINELSGFVCRYFYSAVDAIKDDLEMSTTLFLPKTVEFSTNIEAIYSVILEAFEKNKKPVILLGHSKGAEEIFHVILRHPELVTENKVDRVVLIQGSIQGCGILDDSLLYTHVQYVKKFSELFLEGIECLDPKQAKNKLDFSFDVFQHKLLNQYGERVALEKRQLISDRIFYVRSIADKTDLSLCTRCIIGGLSGSGLAAVGPNDGLLLVEDQKDDRIGRDLGLIHEDHNAIAISFLWGGRSYNDRKAFIRTVIQQVYR